MPEIDQDPSVDVEFGDRLRRVRNAKGWTQAQLADRTGVSKRSVEDYERGRVPRKALPKLAAALDVSPYYLAHGRDRIEDRIDALIAGQEQLTLRIAQLEEVLASGVEAQRRVWVSLDATLRLLLAQVASREVLAMVEEPRVRVAHDTDEPGGEPASVTG